MVLEKKEKQNVTTKKCDYLVSSKTSISKKQQDQNYTDQWEQRSIVRMAFLNVT